MKIDEKQVTSPVCRRGRERKFWLIRKWPWHESCIRTAWWGCLTLTTVWQVWCWRSQSYHFNIFNTGMCIINQNLFLATGNWKHVFEAVFPSRQPWHHELWPSSALPCASLSSLTQGRRPLCGISCTLESLPLPYPVFNKAFLCNCSLVLALFLTRRTWSQGSPWRRDHCPVGAAAASSLGTLTQRPSRGVRCK